MGPSCKSIPKAVQRVKDFLRHRTIVCVLCLLLLATPSRAKADQIQNDVIGVAIAIAAVGAGIGIGVFYLIHANNSLNGCTASSATGLELRQKDDAQVWVLIGDTAAIKPGDRVRVSGKKKKKNGSGARQFVVEKLAKDYGACP